MQRAALGKAQRGSRLQAFWQGGTGGAGAAGGGVAAARGPTWGVARASAPFAGSAGEPTSVGETYRPPAAAPYPNPLAGAPTARVVPIHLPGGIEFLEGPVWLAALDLPIPGLPY